MDKRYRDLLHAIWHAMDDAEEINGGRIVLDKKHVKKLQSLVPEEHPGNEGNEKDHG